MPGLSFLLCLALRQAAVPHHLAAARQLVDAIRPAQTSYRHKDSLVVWPADGPAECRTDCSGFWGALISHAYPAITSERIEGWLGKKRPQAEDYFAAIRDGVGFHPRSRIADVRPGDFIAIKYEAGAENPGHAVIVDEAPHEIEAKEPIAGRTRQYSVSVIDVTSSPHGVGDSRGKSTGLGRGKMRLYANPDGTFAGHAWSLSPTSKFRPMTLRPMAVGELDVAGIPKIEAFLGSWNPSVPNPMLTQIKNPGFLRGMIARLSAAKGRAKPLQT